MYGTKHVSTYRYQTCEVLTRIYYVTGQEFPISGDAPLRMQAHELEQRSQEIYRDALPTHQRNPCDECAGTGQYVDTLNTWHQCQACHGTGRHQC